MPICNMAAVVQWHLRRVAACALLLFYVNCQSRNRKVWTKPHISRNPSRGAYNTFVQELRAEDAAAFKTFLCMDQTCFNKLLELLSHKAGLVNLVNKFKHRFTLGQGACPPFCEVTRNHVNRAQILIDWKLATHVCQSFTRQIQVYQQKSWWKSWQE